jgi:hypothetical protein
VGATVPADSWNIVDKGATTEETNMANRVSVLAAVALFGASLSTLSTSTSATPLSGALAIKNAVPSSVETVRWGGGWGGRGWGGGGWRGGGWGGGGWGWRGPGWGWGGAAIVGAPLVGIGISCWRWVPTAWGWQRAWVCGGGWGGGGWGGWGY